LTGHVIVRRTAADASLTRNAILRAAHQSFAEVGFANSSLDAIAASASVTRGAVHHHFGNKIGLFQEVFIEVTKDVAAVTLEAAKEATTLWGAFVAGIDSLIAYMGRPDFVQIAVGDAPSVLGFTQWHKLNRSAAVESLSGIISRLHDAGVIVVPPAEQQLVTLLLFGALSEAGLATSREGGPSPLEVRESFLALVLKYQAPNTDLSQIKLD
jgi:AcrR family transcriptional regulator